MTNTASSTTIGSSLSSSSIIFLKTIFFVDDDLAKALELSKQTSGIVSGEDEQMQAALAASLSSVFFLNID